MGPLGMCFAKCYLLAARDKRLKKDSSRSLSHTESITKSTFIFSLVLNHNIQTTFKQLNNMKLTFFKVPHTAICGDGENGIWGKAAFWYSFRRNWGLRISAAFRVQAGPICDSQNSLESTVLHPPWLRKLRSWPWWEDCEESAVRREGGEMRTLYFHLALPNEHSLQLQSSINFGAWALELLKMAKARRDGQGQGIPTFPAVTMGQEQACGHYCRAAVVLREPLLNQ